jgi:peptidoglycan/LPS O-acetylase OafA/YrhL
VFAAMLAPFLLAVAVNQIHTAWPAVLAVLRWYPLRWLGLISYSVYLWQQPLYRMHLGLAGLVVAVAVGAGSFYLFESPIRRWLNANWGQSTVAPDMRSRASARQALTASSGPERRFDGRPR